MEQVIKDLQETQARLERKNSKTGDVDLSPEIERIGEITRELSESIQPKKTAPAAKDKGPSEA